MNNAPIYRRRRRVALALAVTVAAVPFLLLDDPSADIPTCHAWQNRTECNNNNKGK